MVYHTGTPSKSAYILGAEIHSLVHFFKKSRNKGEFVLVIYLFSIYNAKFPDDLCAFPL